MEVQPSNAQSGQRHRARNTSRSPLLVRHRNQPGACLRSHQTSLTWDVLLRNLRGRMLSPPKTTEAETIEVARKLLARRGRDAFSLSDVAAFIGIRPPPLYGQFANHAALITALEFLLWRELGEVLGVAARVRLPFNHWLHKPEPIAPLPSRTRAATHRPLMPMRSAPMKESGSTPRKWYQPYRHWSHHS